MRQPDFFVVGAAKSGTTALWKYFQKHPEIFVTDSISNKELGYYSNQYGIKSKKKYLSYFCEAKPNQMIGEVCHVYLTSEESAEWIKKDVPGAKIIIMLRNPVERAYSLYNWMAMHGYESEKSFEKALIQEDELLLGTKSKSKLLHRFYKNYLYFNSGLYNLQVMRFYKSFDKKNVLVLEYSDFMKNQSEILKEIFRFLNVNSNIKIEKLNTNMSKRIRWTYFQFLIRKFSFTKYGASKKAKKIINVLMAKNVINKKPKNLKLNTKVQLENKYLKDITELSFNTGIDFLKLWYGEKND
jgi:hypothetical protein